MQLKEFDYNLPQNLIAQSPLKDRASSKLMIVNKKTGNIKHEVFNNIINYLKKGDVLVINDTKVIPARIIGKKDTGAKIELLLLKEVETDIWECMVRPQKRVKKGTIIYFSKDLKTECIKVLGDGISKFKMIYNGLFLEILESIGSMPLPPYIKEKLKDKNRYQTVYAKYIGSAAAPTAGLHFTKELLKEIEQKEIQIAKITLHVGLGTFKPVNEAKIENHKMHSEFYKMTEETAHILNKAKKEKRRIICVGTTSVRTLESVYTKYNTFKECSGTTNIFIYPPYDFKAVDALITNFHLPKSTLLMLVSAFATKEIILNAYNEAVKNNYRFFSFGDAMFLE